VPDLSSIIQPTFPTSRAPPRKCSLIPSGASVGYVDEDPAVYSTTVMVKGRRDMNHTPSPSPLFPVDGDRIKMGSKAVNNVTIIVCKPKNFRRL